MKSVFEFADVPQRIRSRSISCTERYGIETAFLIGPALGKK